MRRFAARGQLEFVCPWRLAPVRRTLARGRHRLTLVNTVTAYREMPKPCYTARPNCLCEPVNTLSYI